MKKLGAILVAVSAVMLMAVSAYASSPSGTATGAVPTTAEDFKPTVPASQVAPVSTVQIVPWTGNGGAEFQSYINETKGSQTIAVFELAGEPGDVTLTVPGLTQGTTYVVLHMKKSGQMEVLPATVSGNTITFNVKEFSPFAIVAVPAAGVKSPNTGAEAALPFASLVGAVSLLGATGFRFKKIR